MPPKILIAGAGIAGLTLSIALALAQAPLSITIYEKRQEHETRDDGFSLHLGPPAGRVFKNLGLWDDVRACGGDVHYLRMRDIVDGETLFEVDVRDKRGVYGVAGL